MGWHKQDERFIIAWALEFVLVKYKIYNIWIWRAQILGLSLGNLGLRLDSALSIFEIGNSFSKTQVSLVSPYLYPFHFPVSQSAGLGHSSSPSVTLWLRISPCRAFPGATTKQAGCDKCWSELLLKDVVFSHYWRIYILIKRKRQILPVFTLFLNYKSTFDKMKKFIKQIKKKWHSFLFILFTLKVKYKIWRVMLHYIFHFF